MLGQSFLVLPVAVAWGDTTIRGQADRSTGLLNNAAYVGRLEWNRCSYTRGPSTGRRVTRPNPREEWEVTDAPELRIVDDKLWDRVKRQQKAVRTKMARTADGNALNRAHRKRHILSGLIISVVRPAPSATASITDSAPTVLMARVATISSSIAGS